MNQSNNHLALVFGCVLLLIPACLLGLALLILLLFIL